MSSGGGRGRKRAGLEEEHENHERWLVSYADMVTVLMILFIVMFAMGQVDQKKFDALRSGLAAGFGQAPTIHHGANSILDQPGQAAVAPIAPSRFSVDNLAESSEISRSDAERSRQRRAEATEEVNRYQALIARIYAALDKKGLREDVQTTIDERGLVVSLVSKHIVFDANISSLTDRGQRIIDTLAPVLKSIPDPLQIDGHTNQVPVKPKYYPTDWELSAARAVTVLRHLSEVDGIPDERLTASAFGHTKPLIDPKKAGSQAVNKRVDIVVLSTLPTETRSLIEDVVRESGKSTSIRARSRAGGGLS